MPAKAVAAKSSSPGEVFDQVESLLKRYSPPFAVGPGANVGTKRHYDLISRKEVVIAGKARTEVWFASVIEQKNYIGFYYMPVYMAPAAIRGKISPRLLKLLKGKSCFYLKSVDHEVLADIKAALDLGMKHYREQGWL